MTEARNFMMRAVPLPGKAVVWPLTVSGGTLCALAGLVLSGDPAMLRDLTRPFEVAHGLFASAIVSVVCYAVLMTLLWPVGKLLAGAELLSRLAAGGVIAAALPFAQAAGPGEGKAGSAGGAATATAGHEIQAGAYMGYNETMSSRVRFTQPNGTDLTFEGLKWEGDSLKTEPYWGLRGTYWNPKLRGFGVMFDYTHAKATGVRDQALNQSGTRDGEEVPPVEPFSATFRKLEFTHGLNFFTLNGVFRMEGLHPRIAPYAGIGLGLSVPHVDTRRAGAPQETRTYEHQIAGLTFQVLGGIEWRLLRSRRVSAFTEYKLNRSSVHGDLNGGGFVETGLWTHQVPIGFSYHHFLGAK